MVQKQIANTVGRISGLLALVGIACLGHGAHKSAEQAQPQNSSSHLSNSSGTKRDAQSLLARTPLLFEHNVGQFSSDVRFLSRGDGCDVALTSNEAVLELKSPAKEENVSDEAPTKTKQQKHLHAHIDVLRLGLRGASKTARMGGSEAAHTKVNYFVGKNPKGWHTNVATYGQVRYAGVYPGVDMVYYGNHRQLEYDFVVAPHAIPGQIRMTLSGARQMELNARGELVMRVGEQTVTQKAPVVYQTIAGKWSKVEGRYVVKSNPASPTAAREVGFAIGHYNHNLPLVIDPTIAYSTMFYEEIVGIAADGAGNAYISGDATPADYVGQTLVGGKKATFLNGQVEDEDVSQIYIAKINASCSAVDFMTFYGSRQNHDNGDGGGTSTNHYVVGAGNLLALDATGNVYAMGNTTDTDLPTPNGFQTALGTVGPNSQGGLVHDGFLFKLDPTGSKLLYATYLGGGDAGTDDLGHSYPGNTEAAGLAVDASGNAYLAGDTNALDFPCKNAYATPASLRFHPNAFVTKINTNVSGTNSLSFSTLFGSMAYGYGLTIDQTGNAYLVGVVGIDPSVVNQDTGDVPTDVFPFVHPLPGTRTQFPRYRDENGGLHDGYYGGGYLAKFSPSGALLFSTVDIGGLYGALAHDSSSGLYVVWQSNQYEKTPGGIVPSQLGTINNSRQRVAKINDDASGLIYETDFGSDSSGATRGGTPFLEWPLGAAVDSQGRVAVAGFTNSLGFPHADPLPTPFSPSSTKKNAAAYLVQLSADGHKFVFSTEYGGDGLYQAEGVSIDPSDNIYVAGHGGFQGIPTQNGLPIQYGSGFVLKLGTPFNTGVNSTADNDDVNPGDGACYTGRKTSTGAPECTLRASIEEANASKKSEPYPITFNIPGQGANIPSIAPKKPLPATSHTVKIDGTTQPTSNRVELTGGSAGTASGLTILAGGSTVQGLVVNAFKSDGILLMNRGGNTIQNCYIGTDKTGASAKGNGQSGIHALKSPNNLIGGATVAQRNLISGTRVANTQDKSGDNGFGVWIEAGSAGNQIEGNFIGTDKTGAKAVPNGIGIVVSPSTTATSATALNAHIGGLAKTPGTAPGNLISGNSNAGLIIAYSSGSMVQGNLVGTNLAGTVAVSNALTGIRVFRAPGNTIGGTAVGARNVVSGNKMEGVQIFGLQAAKNTIAGNYIGTDISGTKALGNVQSNLSLLGCGSNTVGGTTDAARNIIAGSPKGYGVLIQASNTRQDSKSGIDVANANTVVGNYIGTNVSGGAAVPNAFGLVIDAGSKGGLTASKNTVTSNTVSGNSSVGVGVVGEASANTVQGNLIGTNPIGSSALGNGIYGLVVQQASSTTIASNTISSNGRAGVVFVGTYPSGYGVTGFPAPASENFSVGGNVLKSNYIGTTTGGLRALGNGARASRGTGAGVLVLPGGGNGNGGNSIGVPGAGNVIAGNIGAGIAFLGGTNNVVAANLIGVSGNGVAGLPNTGAGVSMSCTGNNIGGIQAAQGNTIAYNGGAGVSVVGGSDNPILSNLIFSNKKLGIDLVGGKQSNSGVTQNDHGDGDSGANNLQNYPEITSVKRSSGSVLIGGTLDSKASTAYVIQFFANVIHDPSGYGQGQRLLGNLNVTTSKEGHATFTFKYSGALATTEAVSMTATGAKEDLSTSEFSALPFAITGGVYRYITDPHNAKATIRQGIAGVTLQRLEDGELAAQESTDVDGTYSFSAAPPGQFALVPSFKGPVYPFVFAPMLRAVTLRASSGATRDATGVDFFTYNIGGIVKNAAGKAMSGIKVTLGASTDDGDFTRTVTTNTQGAYLFDGLGLGTYKVTASGYVASISSLKLPSTGVAGISPNGQINLAPATTSGGTS